jgi:hypothetical protein
MDRFGWSDREPLAEDHVLQGVLPAVRSCPFPREVLHVSMLVACVAIAAFGDHQRVGDRNAFFALGRILCQGRLA